MRVLRAPRLGVAASDGSGADACPSPSPSLSCSSPSSPSSSREGTLHTCTAARSGSHAELLRRRVTACTQGLPAPLAKPRAIIDLGLGHSKQVLGHRPALSPEVGGPLAFNAARSGRTSNARSRHAAARSRHPRSVTSAVRRQLACTAPGTCWPAYRTFAGGWPTLRQMHVGHRRLSCRRGCEGAVDESSHYFSGCRGSWWGVCVSTRALAHGSVLHRLGLGDTEEYDR